MPKTRQEAPRYECITHILSGDERQYEFTIEDIPHGNAKWQGLGEENHKRMWGGEGYLWASAQNGYVCGAVKYNLHQMIVDAEIPDFMVHVFLRVVEVVPKAPQTLVMYVRKIETLEVTIRCHEPIGELVTITTSAPCLSTIEIRRDATFAKLKKMLLEEFSDFGCSMNWRVKVLVEGKEGEGHYASNTRVATVLGMIPLDKKKLPPKGTCRIEKFVLKRPACSG